MQLARLQRLAMARGRQSETMAEGMKKRLRWWYQSQIRLSLYREDETVQDENATNEVIGYGQALINILQGFKVVEAKAGGLKNC
jgi:hypothetical protein